MNTVQRTLVEAWGLIRESFIDPTFNHQGNDRLEVRKSYSYYFLINMDLTGTMKTVDWDQKLQQTMVEMFPLRTADAAYNKISGMLSTLGDPFTRIISPKVLQFTLLRKKLLTP